MKLEFRLLVVDDDPRGIETALDILRDHLPREGLRTGPGDCRRLFGRRVRELVTGEGRNFDLAIVDYNLGDPDTDGALVADRLRRDMQYTDMVFYSSDPTRDLYATLAGRRVSGVFVEERTGLDEALTGLADTVIGKVVDVNHMRGIAMAEVAEMDVLMEETLVRVFASPDPAVGRAKARTIGKLREGFDSRSEAFRERLGEAGLFGVLRDSALFSTADRYRAVRRLARALERELAEPLQVLESFDREVIRKRNILAHAKEELRAGAPSILRSIRPGVPGDEIDDEWMSRFRRTLGEQRSALADVCGALVGRFGGGAGVGDVHEDGA